MMMQKHVHLITVTQGKHWVHGNKWWFEIIQSNKDDKLIEGLQKDLIRLCDWAIKIYTKVNKEKFTMIQRGKNPSIKYEWVGSEHNII